jgi:hypothetical protein
MEEDMEAEAEDVCAVHSLQDVSRALVDGGEVVESEQSQSPEGMVKGNSNMDSDFKDGGEESASEDKESNDSGKKVNMKAGPKKVHTSKPAMLCNANTCP